MTLVRNWIARYLCVLQVGMTAFSQQPPVKGLHVKVVEGSGASHSIRTRTGAASVVEVRDASGKPVAGARILFEVPETGPGGRFAGDQRTLEVKTNLNGRAATSGFVPNNTPGAFSVAVTVSLNDLTERATIWQNNSLERFDDGSPVGNGRWKWWVAGLAAAGGGVGLAFAFRGSGTTATPGITPGSPSIGGPR